MPAVFVRVEVECREPSLRWTGRLARIQGADDDPRGARDASGRVLLHRGTPPESYTGSCTDSRLLAAVLRYRGE